MKPAQAEARPSLLSLVAKEEPRKARSRWFDHLPDDVRGEVMEAKRLWRSGELKGTPSSMARRIVKALKGLGVDHVPGVTSVWDWLTE